MDPHLSSSFIDLNLNHNEELFFHFFGRKRGTYVSYTDPTSFEKKKKKGQPESKIGIKCISTILIEEFQN